MCMASSVVPDEIIVVNDGGELSLLDEIRAIKKNTKIVYARIDQDIKWNYTGARNLGVWLSSGTLLSMEDNDHMPSEKYYEEAMKEFENPNIMRFTCFKRIVVGRENLNKLSTRAPHEDTAILRRDVFLQTKGFDERFAGEYGWSSTAWRRRLTNAKLFEKTKQGGYMYVLIEEKTRKERGALLSYRNHRMAKNPDIQHPEGILNFTYVYEQIGN